MTEFLRLTPMIKSLLDRFERNGMRRISSWILACFITGWVLTLAAMQGAFWLDGHPIAPEPGQVALLWKIAWMTIAFYLVRTIAPLGMRILAVELLKEDVEHLLTSTPDPDPVPPSPPPPSKAELQEALAHIQTQLQSYGDD